MNNLSIHVSIFRMCGKSFESFIMRLKGVKFGCTNESCTYLAAGLTVWPLRVETNKDKQ